ncbi:thiol:disulfide interchange protein [Aquaticitalea lipolytica]|uniref:Thiol:disulfide interchange protein n=2 Tax=Aquaticitalea lipolytica TaxID=1247562 RepID=A0A8J2TNE3_9FLAO|nr:thiol:disulfide interchange protein [Aquaticitalea lipolytica]
MKMKKLFSLILIVSLFISCNETTKKNDGYVISGTADGVYNGIRVYLKTIDERGRDFYQDTAVVVDGKFKFEGKIDIPEMWFLSVNSIDGYIPIMVENENITVTVNKDNINTSTIHGTKANDALTEYNEGFNILLEKRSKIGRENMGVLRSTDSIEKANFSATMAEMEKEMNSYPFDFLANHKDNYFSLKLIESLMTSSSIDLSKIEDSFNNLDESVKSSGYGRVVFSKISVQKLENERLGSLNLGKVAPNFTAPDPNGKMISLNEIKGKVTIIDFWASWCGPCRRENPNVVKTYNKYHNKGLEIISVSLDRAGQKDKWLKAIEDDKLTWHHVSNLNYFNDPVAKQYNIQSIPSTYILDSEGKIAAKNLRGKALEDKVAELLN